jgi:hypothetical protein
MKNRELNFTLIKSYPRKQYALGMPESVMSIAKYTAEKHRMTVDTYILEAVIEKLNLREGA